jgi:DnaK suppressor protein
MKVTELQTFKELLLKHRQVLTETMSSLEEAGKTVELDQTRVGRLSRMDAMQGQQMALESERRSKQKLLAIDAALQRIEAGNFGLCSDCDEEINPKRLEGDPTHTLCIDCASKVS